jgi:hypothetical protein
MSGAPVVAAARAAAAAAGVPGAKKDDGKKEDKEDKDDAKDQEKAKVADKKSTADSSKKIAKSSSPAEESQEEKTVTKVEEPKVETNLAQAVIENTISSVVVIAQSAKPDDSEVKLSTVAEAVSTSEKENSNVKKLWKDKSETQQVGWGYESLSTNTRNYANVVLPLDTKAQVTVTQDMQSTTWIFGQGKAQGQIFINQNFR